MIDFNNVMVAIKDIPIMCEIIDEHGNTVYINPFAKSIIGITNGISEDYSDYYTRFSVPIQPDGTPTLDKFKSLINKCLKHDRAEFDWMHKSTNGEEIPARVTFVKILWKGEECIAAFSQDLRNHYENIKHLEDLKYRLSIIIDSSPLACAIVNKDIKYIEANREMLRMFNFDNKDNLSEKLITLSPRYQPDGRLSIEKRLELFKMCFETGWIQSEWMHITKNSEPMPCEVTLVRSNLDNEAVAICYIRDLREIRKAVEMKNHLENLAFIDSLTRIYNRRYFMNEAERTIKDCKENNQKLSIILMDIDKFKDINDTYGHLVGDEVLRIVAERSKNIIRKKETIARYGGEEFIILLPNANIKEAIATSQRIRKNISSNKFRTDDHMIKVTASFGVSSLTDQNNTLEDMIRKADAALYLAKNNGRNRVETM